MFELLTLATVVAGFVFVILAGAMLGTSSLDSFSRLFIVDSTMPDRPRRMQEEDLPRFVFRDAAPVSAT